jgi:hypothetical protein
VVFLLIALDIVNWVGIGIDLNLRKKVSNLRLE